MNDIADKHRLRPHFIFNTSVVTANWDAKANLWHIVTINVQTGETSNTSAKVLISAAGILAEPNRPYINGAEEFKGTSFHSAEWDHTVDLHGKRVAIIGNGASAQVPIYTLLAIPLTCLLAGKSFQPSQRTRRLKLSTSAATKRGISMVYVRSLNALDFSEPMRTSG
jgi:thioredoxin reductase